MKEHIERFRRLEGIESGSGSPPERALISHVDPSEIPPASDKSTMSHLKTYLDYYRSCDDPGYAVLITGPWGTGKTFQVREALPKDKAYYVSLFGLNSTDDVTAAVYAAMFPGKAWVKKLADKVGETSAEVPGIGSLAVNGLTSGLVGAFLRQEVDKSKPIIFDDLERCGLGVKETLGIINLYVEHHGCRVIVIAHDDKLMKEFIEAKEKIFGQTIRVEPQVAAAFGRFHSTLANGIAKDLIDRQKEDILAVFAESKAHSLRILRHVIDDLARLMDALDEKHRSHEAAVGELVRLFSAFDIEWRAGRLEATDLHGRREATAYSLFQRSKDSEKKPARIKIAQDRYKSVDLTNTLLQDDVLSQILIESRFDKATIQASLDASSYFVKPNISPPWRIVSGFDKLEDEVVAEGLTEMQQQFNNREVSDSGEMLHIFALLMMMASEGVLSKDVKTVEAECKAYIDDLLRGGRLPPRGSDSQWHDDFSRSSHGYSYWVSREYEQEFISVRSHLIEARSKAFEAEFLKLVPEMLEVVKTDGQQFFELVCHTSKGNNRYASIPILAAIVPEDFVAAWMRSPKVNWYWISSALRDRYNSGYVGKELKPERKWIENVVRLLKEEEDKASGLAKVRIQRIIPNITLSDEEPSSVTATPIASLLAPADEDAVIAEEDSGTGS